MRVQTESQKYRTLKVLKNHKGNIGRKELAKLACNSVKASALNRISTHITSLRKQGYAIRKTRSANKVLYRYLGETQVPRKPAKPAIVQISNDLVEKCLYLIKANSPKTVTVDHAASFFDLSMAAAGNLLYKVHETHLNMVKFGVQLA